MAHMADTASQQLARPRHVTQKASSLVIGSQPLNGASRIGSALCFRFQSPRQPAARAVFVRVLAWQMSPRTVAMETRITSAGAPLNCHCHHPHRHRFGHLQHQPPLSPHPHHRHHLSHLNPHHHHRHPPHHHPHPHHHHRRLHRHPCCPHHPQFPRHHRQRRPYRQLSLSIPTPPGPMHNGHLRPLRPPWSCLVVPTPWRWRCCATTSVTATSTSRR